MDPTHTPASARLHCDLYLYRKDVFFVAEQQGHRKVETTGIYTKALTTSKLEQMQAFGDAFDSMTEADTNG